MESTDEVVKELRNAFRDQQEKYNYYILSLNAAGIGFSFYNTIDQSLKWIQIPLGFALLSWGISTFCGMKFIAYIIANYKNNMEYLKMNIQEQAELKLILAENSSFAKKYASTRNTLFYLGILCFTIWRILEMYAVSQYSL